ARVTDDPKHARRAIGRVTPLLDCLEEPPTADEALAQQSGDTGVRGSGPQVSPKLFDLPSKAAALLTLYHAENLGELLLIPPATVGAAEVALLPPVMHVQPLDVADAGRRLHLRLALHQDGLDVASPHPNGDSNLVKAHARIACRVSGEKGDKFVARGDAFCDRATPVVPGFDLALVEPHLVPACF